MLSVPAQKVSLCLACLYLSNASVDVGGSPVDVTIESGALHSMMNLEYARKLHLLLHSMTTTLYTSSLEQALGTVCIGWGLYSHYV